MRHFLPRRAVFSFAGALNLALAVIPCLSLPACDKDKAKVPAPASQAASDNEITTNPKVLYDWSVSPVEFTLYGVKVSDPESAIPAADRMGEVDESGWIGFKGRPNVFRVENGRVRNMSVTDPELLAKLGIKNEADLLQQFGKDYKTEKFGPDDRTVPYFFKDRWLNLTWDRQQNAVTAINIGP